MNKITIDDIKNNDLFNKYYDILIEENTKYNLTAITDKEEVYYKHFLDCAEVLNNIDLNDKKIADVGSGAGFPGIVLKVLCPSLELTIIEPIGKRCNFLSMLCEKLGLNNVTILNKRAEDIKELKNHFDYVFARAVSNLPVLTELCVPLVKVDGFFIALKGSNYAEELELSKNAIKELKCELINVKTYELKDFGLHSILFLKKKQETSEKYPRQFAQIKRKPL